MLVSVDTNFNGLGNAIAPFELDIFDDAWLKTVAPARVDNELSADAGVFEFAFVGQPGLLEELAASCFRVCLPRIQATGNRLPEFERAGTLQEQYLAIVTADDDKDGERASFTRHAACEVESRLP